VTATLSTTKGDRQMTTSADMSHNHMTRRVFLGAGATGAVLATAALAQGDLHGSMREKHRGAFGQLQRNFNLAVATFRAVLGEQGADQFADKAAKFRQMLTTFKSNEVSFGLRMSDEGSRPIPSPAHDLWVKLADALDGPQNDSGKTA